MRIRTANHVAIDHVWQVHVVNIISSALDKARILLALHAVAHAADFWTCLLHHFPPCAIFLEANCTAFTMFWYPVQRQRLPEIPQRISASVGFEFFFNSA